MASKVQRYKRKAAAKVFFHLFSVMTNVMFQMQFNHLEWGDDVFTDKEKAYIDKLKTRINQDAEACRQLGQRLKGASK